MKRVDVNKEFTFYMTGEGKEANCILHFVEIDTDDARYESVGEMNISIEGSDYYTEFSFAIWGNGEIDDEYEQDFDGCYVCLPTQLEYDEDDELEIVHLFDMLQGLVDPEELGI